MEKNPLSLAVDEEEVPPPTSTRDMGRIDKPSEPTYGPPAGMRFNMAGELERIPSGDLPTIDEAMEGLSPSQKADLAWDIATGKTPITSPASTPRADEPPAPEPTEKELAREYFRLNHKDKKGRLKAGGENLFDGRQGGVNRDLTYYHNNKVGYYDDEAWRS